jgi:hypothetical protein
MPNKRVAGTKNFCLGTRMARSLYKLFPIRIGMMTVEKIRMAAIA